MNKDEYPLHITHNSMVVRLYQQQSCEIPQVKQSKPTQMQHDCSIKDDVVMISFSFCLFFALSLPGGL